MERNLDLFNVGIESINLIDSGSGFWRQLDRLWLILIKCYFLVDWKICICKGKYANEKHNQEVSHVKERVNDDSNEPAELFEVAQEEHWTQPDAQSCKYLDCPEIFFVSLTRVVDIGHVEHRHNQI